MDGQDNEETQLMQLVGGNEEDAEVDKDCQRLNTVQTHYALKTAFYYLKHHLNKLLE